MSVPVEIERKYVILLPSTEILRAQEGYTVSEIRQTYLKSEPGVTHRVRMRSYADRTVYTETRKTRIDRMSSFEDEREISREEYGLLLELRHPDTVTLTKTRHTFLYLGKTFEIDVYPEWQRSCIMETELESREESVGMPDFIRVLTEVTGDKKYSNASMSHSFPAELI